MIKQLSLIKRNPEFQRYLWLKFSWVKIIITPVVIFLSALLLTEFDIINYPADIWAKDLFFPLITAFYTTVFIIGNYEAARAFPIEINNKTWDFQRMSSLSAWQIVIGKIFGSTSYIWYVGFILLAFLGGTMIASPEFIDISVYNIGYLIMLLIWAGVIGHITAFMFSIYLGGGAGFFAGLIASHIVFSTNIILDKYNILTTDIINWFEYSINSIWFLYASLLFFSFWLLTGAVHIIRSHMRFSNMPLAWLGFTITINLYIIGFLGYKSESFIFAYLSMGFGMLAWTYLSMFIESSEIQKYKRFICGFQSKNIYKTLENTPRWLITFLIAIICFIIVLSDLIINEKKSTILLFTFIISTCLFVIRDGLVLHIFVLGKKLKYASLGILLYYILMYIVFPGLLIASSEHGLVSYLKDIASDKYTTNIPLSFFYPIFSNLIVSIVPVLLECIFCIYLLILRLKNTNKEFDTKKSAI